MKKIKLLLIVNILMITISSIMCVYAASYLYNSNEVSYNHNASGLSSNDVQGAIDELYSSASDYATINSLIYPVGSIYISVTDSTVASVEARFGGTWEKFAEGKTLIGYDSSDNDFDTILETGGSKTHAHTHGDLRAKIGTYSSSTNAIGYVATGADNPATGASGYKTFLGIANGSNSTNRPMNHYTQVVGTFDSRSSLQPYITAYIYRRIA